MVPDALAPSVAKSSTTVALDKKYKRMLERSSFLNPDVVYVNIGKYQVWIYRFAFTYITCIYLRGACKGYINYHSIGLWLVARVWPGRWSVGKDGSSVMCHSIAHRINTITIWAPRLYKCYLITGWDFCWGQSRSMLHNDIQYLGSDHNEFYGKIRPDIRKTLTYKVW